MILSTALFLAMTSAGVISFASYNPDKRRRARERDMSKDVSAQMSVPNALANPEAGDAATPGVGDMQDTSEEQAQSLEPKPAPAGSPKGVATLTEGSETGRPPEFDTSGDTDQPSPPEVVQPTVNEICPIDEHRVDPAVPRRQLAGEFLGFCSRDCVAEWDHLPLAEQHDRLEQVDEINE